ncbi:MAG: amidohydrolase family protein [Rhodoferax sp.]|nr:amidohydrolase family protein [Rhodoferax sp.]
MLIRGAQMFDGTGAPSCLADVAIRGDSIGHIGDGAAIQADQVIDASGQIVAPGFIDIHTHSDMSLLLYGRGQSKVSQGVTTEVTGNCGFSPFPINPQHRSCIWTCWPASATMRRTSAGPTWRATAPWPSARVSPSMWHHW